jgi:hypothetical protein
MCHGALEGAATRTCTHQIRLRAHQLEAKVPGPPRRCAGAGHPADPAGPPGHAERHHRSVVPLASPSARWLTRQINKATRGLAQLPDRSSARPVSRTGSPGAAPLSCEKRIPGPPNRQGRQVRPETGSPSVTGPGQRRVRKYPSWFQRINAAQLAIDRLPLRKQPVHLRLADDRTQGRLRLLGHRKQVVLHVHRGLDRIHHPEVHHRVRPSSLIVDPSAPLACDAKPWIGFASLWDAERPPALAGTAAGGHDRWPLTPHRDRLMGLRVPDRPAGRAAQSDLSHVAGPSVRGQGPMPVPFATAAHIPSSNRRDRGDFCLCPARLAPSLSGVMPSGRTHIPVACRRHPLRGGGPQ